MTYRTNNKKIEDEKQPNICIRCDKPLKSMKSSSKMCNVCKNKTLPPLNKICIVCSSDFIDNSRSKNKKVCGNKCDYKRGTDKELSTIQGKLKERLRSRIRSSVKNFVKNGQKAGSAVTDLGCTIEDLKLHLESLFQEGMSWENWSMYGWHIDHIIPLASFNLENREDLLKACHYTNLQPLWAKDNLSKGKKEIS